MEAAGEYDSSQASRMKVALQRAESVLDPTHRHVESLRRPMLNAVSRALSVHFAEATVRGYVRLIDRVVSDWDASRV